MTSHIKNLVADEAEYLASVYDFRHRVAAMLSLRAGDALRRGQIELAAEYRQASLRAAVAELNATA